MSWDFNTAQTECFKEHFTCRLIYNPESQQLFFDISLIYIAYGDGKLFVVACIWGFISNDSEKLSFLLPSDNLIRFGRPNYINHFILDLMTCVFCIIC